MALLIMNVLAHKHRVEFCDSLGICVNPKCVFGTSLATISVDSLVVIVVVVTFLPATTAET